MCTCDLMMLGWECIFFENSGPKTKWANKSTNKSTRDHSTFQENLNPITTPFSFSISIHSLFILHNSRSSFFSVTDSPIRSTTLTSTKTIHDAWLSRIQCRRLVTNLTHHRFRRFLFYSILLFTFFFCFNLLFLLCWFWFSILSVDLKTSM